MSAQVRQGNGGIALSPQRSWNVSGSVRDNVLLGGGDAPVDETAYGATLEAVALDADCDAWQDGDGTVVGEKGLTLSGGQAARLALARCVYACAVGRTQLALLDDPLSAVDPKVAAHLVDDCIRRRLCNDLQVGVVLATHQRQFLDRADRVLVLGPGGKPLAYGSFKEIPADTGGGGHPPEGGGGGNGAKPTEETKPPRRDPSRSVSQVVSKEDREVGVVTWKTWSEFIGSGGPSLVVVVLSMFVAAQAMVMYSDYLVLRWSERRRHRTSSDIYRRYVIFVAAACLLAGLRGVLFFTATLRAATSLHARAIRNVVHAPMAWIQANPFGRILNRFSSDMAQTDDMLSVFMLEFATLFFLMMGSILFACAAVPPLILLLPVLLYAGLQTKRYVSKTMNECKRLDGVTRSPVLSVVAATVHGLSPIRAFAASNVQTAALQRTLTANSKTFYFWMIANRYLGFVLDSYMVCFTAVMVICAIALRAYVDPATSAIALIYSLQLLAFVQYSVRMFAQCEQFLTSVERILAYVRLDTEATLPAKRPSDDDDKDIECGVVKKEWPSDGHIDVVELEYRYRVDAPLVLKGVTVSFPARKKTGLCGRTGSGKSSLLAAFTRLHDVCGGKILIDGVDVSKIPLTQLREAIAVIPQAPALFSGTVRFNIAPLGNRSDDEILEALKESRLLLRKFSTTTTTKAILDTPVEGGGRNWSTGESQLLCLARALVLKRRICCFDEYVISFSVYIIVDFLGLRRQLILKRMLRSKRPSEKRRPLKRRLSL